MWARRDFFNVKYLQYHPRLAKDAGDGKCFDIGFYLRHRWSAVTSANGNPGSTKHSRTFTSHFSRICMFSAIGLFASTRDTTCPYFCARDLRSYREWFQLTDGILKITKSCNFASGAKMICKAFARSDVKTVLLAAPGHRNASGSVTVCATYDAWSEPKCHIIALVC